MIARLFTSLAPCVLSVSAFGAQPPTQLAIDPTWLPSVSPGTQAPYLADFDRDGDLDLFLLEGPTSAAQVARQSRMFENDGHGAFREVTATWLPGQVLWATRADVGDVDADGDLDLVLGCGRFGSAHSNRLYVNTGTGRFVDATVSGLPGLAHETQDVALGDVDNDGDLDLVTGNAGGGEQNRLYLNDGKGMFQDATATWLPTRLDITGVVVLADLDGDGDLDLFYGNQGQQNVLLRNTGSSFVTVATPQFPADLTVDAAFGDIDGDGDPDLVVSNWGQQMSRLYRNDGSFQFTDVSVNLPTAPRDHAGVAFGDLDEDGDLDLVQGTGGMSGRNDRTLLYLNDKTGVFTDATVTRLPFVNDQTLGVALGDLDGDLDLDLVVANTPPSGQQPSYVYRNRLRQTESAAPPVLGQSHVLTFYASAGFAPVGQLLCPWLDLAPARRNPVRTSFGSWLLGMGIPIGCPSPSSPNGEHRLTLLIPNNPVLSGLLLHSQAIVVHGLAPVQLGLSNAVIERL